MAERPGKTAAAWFADKVRPRLSVPMIAAPMFRVSGPDLVIAACKAGVIGAFPTANCRSDAEFAGWLTRIADALGPDDAPFCPNLIIRRETLQDDVAADDPAGLRDGDYQRRPARCGGIAAA
jgi:nitronate monooxygenase